MKTAVEWFESEFKKYYAFSSEEMETFIRMFNQAKAMEKEQMKNAYWYGEYDGHNGSDRNFEEYYNETYKNKEK